MRRRFIRVGQADDHNGRLRRCLARGGCNLVRHWATQVQEDASVILTALHRGTDVWWTKRTLEPTHNAQGVSLQGCLPTKQGR